ncbi:MAG: histidinol-phosphatase HisJ family protein [Candidatus Omnitrophota bacterium]
MKPIVDYHMHTFLCGHAIGEPFEYADHALKLGLKEIGFSDHAPLVSHDDPSITMSFEQLPCYHKMLEDLRAQYAEKNLKIKIGIEADYIPGYEEKTQKILDGYAYDYVYGSVHFIGEFAFDNPQEKERLKTNNIDKVYLDYHALLRKSAQSKLFDIMAHVDLVKKFGDRAKTDLSEEVRKTAEIFKKSEVVIEVNSSGLRKPVKEIYPALSELSIYCQAGVMITFGSDAHAPAEVGYAFGDALQWAKKAGYCEYVVFEKRQIVDKIKF